jgi:hypothetical protein
LPSMRQATATRTSLQRFADVFNVKDFGALGNNSHDDTAAIQAAINAALDNWGGVVYFPAGKYKITRRLEVGTGTRSGNGANLTFLGAGCSQSYESGSLIVGNFHDYLLYISSRGQPVKSIQGLGFKNNAQFTFNSVEAPGNPDNFKGGGWAENEEIPASAFNGGGCVYAGEGLGTGFTIINCEFACTSGICLYLACFCSTILGSRFTGGGWTGDTGASIGVAALQEFEIHACKMLSFGTCIAHFTGGLSASSLNLEVSGIGVRVGSNPLGFWFSNPPTFHPAWMGQASTGGGINLRNFVMESMGNTFIEIDNARDVVMENVNAASYQYSPNTGIWIGYLSNAILRNVHISGQFTSCGIDVASHGSGKLHGIVFENVTSFASAPNNGGSLPGWKLPTSGAFNPWECPVAYFNCNTDGAIPLARLPTSPGSNTGEPTITYPVMITDSTVPAWTGTASNVGKPAVGGGTNKVLVRWNPLSARWVLAG